MYRWIYFSLLNGVFRSRGAGWIPYRTGIRKILEEIKQYKNKKFPKDRLFEVYKSHPVTFTEVFTKDILDSLDRSFLYYLIYDRNQVIRNQDVDHIMPKVILNSLGYDWEKINTLDC